MGLRIVYGKPGTGKSEFCFSEISNLIDKEKKIIVITPEQFSFTAEKKLMEAVKTDAVLNAEVVTLSRLAYRVLNEIGGNKNSLSKCGKAMLIYYILSKNKNNLSFLGRSDENIDLTMRTFTEFKKHGISVQNLKDENEKIEDVYLKTKLNDMTLLYEQFENKIKGSYIEENDLLTLLAEHLKETDFVQDSLIYIDEFSGFTYREYEVIKELIRLAKQVTVTICVDNLKPAINPDTDIFYSNKITLYKLIDLVNENKFKLEEPVLMENQFRFKTEELKFLSDNIYENKSTKYEKNVENIKLFLAKNPYSEVENVAKQISKLVKNKELRYKDISIIAKNIDTYSALVRTVFEQYEIPVFIDEKRDLQQNVIIQYVLAILEILSKNFSNEAVFNYIKLGFCDIEQDEIFKLENYCNKWGIKQSKWKKDFVYDIDDEKKKQEIQRLNDLRKQIIEPLLILNENIKNEKTASGITRFFYKFLQDQNVEQKLEKKVSKLEEKGYIDLANEYSSSYQILIDILDEIVLIFNDEKFTVDNYSKILKIGFKNSGLGKIPGTQDQVIFGDIDRSRSHKVKNVFIIGLNDGTFPTINRNEGFFNDSDREILKQDGLELAKGITEQIYEDNFNIYKAFTTAEEQLYLSYTSTDSEAKSLRPSILIHKVKKIFPKLKEESDVIEKQYEVVNNIVTYEELIENIARLKTGEKIDKLWYEIYNYYKSQNEWKERLIEDLEGLKYTNLPGDINTANIDKLYGNKLNTSVSQLEKYRSCPFSYYLQYGLRLKEKEELKVQSFNTGSFMHETIDEFFEYVREEEISLPEIEEEQILKIVSEIIDKNLTLSKNYIFISTAKYKVLVNRLKRIVSKALKYIIETLIHSDFNIEGTEIEFSEKGKYKPIVLELENGKKVEITGKIDRIDTANSADGKYLRIIDYKSSSKNIDLNEVYAGLQIQLLTYSDAICKTEDIMPAGVFYFSLLEQMVKAEKKVSDEEIEEMIRKNFRMKGLVITIVILLILAGISIQAITNTGLFENAKKAAEESKYANAEEKVKMAVMASYDENASLNKNLLKDSLNKIDGINPKVTEVEWDLKVNVDGYEFTITEYGTVTCVGRKEQEKLPENNKDNPQDAGKEVALKAGWGEETTAVVKTSDGTEVTGLTKVSTVYAVSVGNGETIPVPKGFFYVGGTIDTGVIISDNEADKYDGKTDKTTHEYATKLKGNQFVWIPCTKDEYKKINFGMQNMASWDMETNTAEEEQISKYGGFYVGRYEAGVSTLDEETNTFKESVTFTNNKSLFSAVGIQSGINGWGWQNYDYIARGKTVPDASYPNKATGNIVEKANSIPYYHADYYTAVEMSRRLYDNNSYVQSGLITGTQWDMMMKFLSESSDYSDMKSTNWGNYDNVSLSNLRGYYTNVNTSNASTDGFKDASSFTTNSGTSSWVILTTGSTSQVLRKGLYDVAGNLWEWTQEASYVANLGYNTTYNTYNLRGGSFSNAYASSPACYRDCRYAPRTDTNRGFRPVLYIK